MNLELWQDTIFSYTNLLLHKLLTVGLTISLIQPKYFLKIQVNSFTANLVLVLAQHCCIHTINNRYTYLLTMNTII